MTESKQAAPVEVNKMADVAIWASVFNIICWFLTAIPGFLMSSWSAFEIVTIPLSAIIALAAGIMGIRKVKRYGTGSWQSVIGMIVGVLNILLIDLVLVGISAMVNCC